jgi:hypothetical protein
VPILIVCTKPIGLYDRDETLLHNASGTEWDVGAYAQ